jgi:4-cresol dehydrogenase (hydroxylating)
MNLTDKTYQELKTSLINILGHNGVVADSKGVEVLSRTNVPHRNIPSFVVYPQDASDVQGVLCMARKHGVPVWPVSTGKNWGYGSKSAAYPGGITMVLERMNRIIEINEELGTAIIEPGVTYAQLNTYLKENGIKLWVDSSGSTKDASIIGNALDKGRGVTPYADHFGSLCGMEVVLPDGRKIRTGGGPQDGYPSWNTYKWGTGLFVDGLFAQSNLGIVVQAGLWLMPEPEAYDFFVFEYTAGEDQFADFLKDFRSLIFKGVIKSRPHLANDFAMLCILDQYPNDLLNGKQYLDPEAMQIWKKRMKVPEWTFGCGLYGTKEEVRLHKSITKKTLSRYGSTHMTGICAEKNFMGRMANRIARLVLRLQGKSPQFLDSLIPAIELFKGIPTDHFVKQVYFKSFDQKPASEFEPARDGCGFVWIGPVVPFSPEHISKLMNLVKPLYKKHEFEFFLEIIIESPRSVISLFGLFYDKKSPDESRRAMALYKDIRDVAYKHGYPPYRASVESTQTALDCNPLLKSLITDLKTALDPNNILAPGRYGARARKRE